MSTHLIAFIRVHLRFSIWLFSIAQRWQFAPPFRIFEKCREEPFSGHRLSGWALPFCPDAPLPHRDTYFLILRRHPSWHSHSPNFPTSTTLSNRTSTQ